MRLSYIKDISLFVYFSSMAETEDDNIISIDIKDDPVIADAEAVSSQP